MGIGNSTVQVKSSQSKSGPLKNKVRQSMPVESSDFAQDYVRVGCMSDHVSDTIRWVRVQSSEVGKSTMLVLQKRWDANQPKGRQRVIVISMGRSPWLGSD